MKHIIKAAKMTLQQIHKGLVYIGSSTGSKATQSIKNCGGTPLSINRERNGVIHGTPRSLSVISHHCGICDICNECPLWSSSINLIQSSKSGGKRIQFWFPGAVLGAY